MEELPTPTGRELEILKILWEKGASSVRAVHAALLESTGEEMAFNTVQTLLRIMESKKLVSHQVEGRIFIYSALYSREESAVRFLDRVFDGAASQLLSCLIQSEKISTAELEHVERLISVARQKSRRSRGATA